MFARSVFSVILAAGLGLLSGCQNVSLRTSSGSGTWPGDLMAARLDLEPGQKAALREVFRRHRPRLAERMEALVQARNAAMDLAMDPGVTPEALRPWQEKVADAAVDLARELRSACLEALPVLDASQKAEVRSLLARLQAHAGHLHDRHEAGMLGFASGRLVLTEAQTATLRGILDARRPALTARRQAFLGAVAEAASAAMDPAIPQGMLEERYAEAREKGLAMSVELRAAYLAALPVLTREQCQEAKILVADFRGAVDGLRKLLLGF